jgi:hypothetical protein
MTSVLCPDHATHLSPSEARLLAVDLVLLADEADGSQGPNGFVTRWEVLAELETLRQLTTSLRALAGL